MDPLRLVVKHTFLELEAGQEKAADATQPAMNQQTDPKMDLQQGYLWRRSTDPALGSETPQGSDGTTSTALPLLPMVVSVTPETTASSHLSDTSEEDEEPMGRLETLQTRRASVETTGRRASTETLGRRASVETVGRRGSVETMGRRGSAETTGRRGSVETDRRISVISTVTDLDGDHTHNTHSGFFRMEFGGLDAPWAAAALQAQGQNDTILGTQGSLHAHFQAPPQAPPLLPCPQPAHAPPQPPPPAPPQAYPLQSSSVLPPPQAYPPYHHPIYNTLPGGYAPPPAPVPGYYSATTSWPWASWASAANFATNPPPPTAFPTYNNAAALNTGSNGHAGSAGFGSCGAVPAATPPFGSRGNVGHEPKESREVAQKEQGDNRTTVMLRNLPERFTRDTLVRLFDQTGFAGLYDFVYMPMNFRTKASFGYAFVNMVLPSDAHRCHNFFQGFSRWGVATEKVCEVSWSDMHQGLAAHIERYRNSPIMHDTVPDDYKPAMFSRGTRIQFPPPTKKLRVPRVRRALEGGDAGTSPGDDADEDVVAAGASSYFSASSPPQYHACHNPGRLAAAA